MKKTNSVVPRPSLGALIVLLLLCSLAAPLSAQPSRGGDSLQLELQFREPMPSGMDLSELLCMKPIWEAGLPFVPDAAAVRDARLWIASLDGGRLAVAHIGIGPNGPLAAETATESAWTISRPVVLSGVLESPGPLLALEDYWLVGLGEGKVAVAPLEASSHGTLEVPLTSLQTAVAADGIVYIAGSMENGGVRIVSAALGYLGTVASGQKPTVDWKESLPLPQRRHGLALFVHNGYVYVAGGEGTVNGKKVLPREMVRAQILEQGELTSWQLAVQLFPYGLGRTQIATVGAVHLATGDSHTTLEGDAMTSQTLLRGATLEGGVLSMWKEYTFCIPATEEALLVPGLPGTYQFLLVGGRPAGADAADPVVRAYETSQSQYEAAASRAKIQKIRSGPAGIPTVEFTTGLHRATNEQKHHMVIVIDPDADNSELRHVLVNRNAKQMMRGLVVSNPAPEELAKVQDLLGTTATPTLALLSPGGRPIAVEEGVPDLAGLFRLLSPAWAPVDSEP